MPPQPSRQRSFLKRVTDFLSNDRGLAVTEYGLLVSLIAVAVVVAVYLFGQAIQSWFGAKTGQVTTY